ncbi:MmgE/PrpD family protein [Streptomyces sp. NBC_01754]|uniref:MmgE/PrpD family protein n=1 Tax=Streptomyces sp. NBC_01754 TaxID=2975930 RepID=UPI002DD8ED73|nr:MmgE/PrpD family protein [Streptomyces sp. NBC_01754]WSC93503.1 MmgE/PrpD family protein [Streptomyces sp. NBC_01754]
MTVLTEIAARSRDAGAGADPAALATAGRHVLDTMACVLSGTTHPLAARWLPLLPAGPPDGPAAVGTSMPRGFTTAVEIEATLAHLDEFDPLHGPSAVAPGAVVVPAALLVGADLHASGEQVARAVVAGYEAVVEAALRFGGPALYAAGWWPTALFGALGSAAATASLLGLDAPATGTALALAASTLGGLLSSDHLGDAHYLLCGRAAAHGTWSARAAHAGLTASTSLLDGPATAALGRPPAPPSPAGEPHIGATALKTWPCARPLHTALAALEDLAADGVRPAPGDTVEIALPSAALHFVTDRPEPADPTEAAASAAVAVAGAVAGRARDPLWYREAGSGGFTLPDITVRLRADPGLDALFPARWGAEVTVRSDGVAARRRRLVAPGDPDLPLTDEELIAKATALIALPGAAPVIPRLLRLADEPDLAPVRAALRGVPPVPAGVPPVPAGVPPVHDRPPPPG